ISLKFIKKMKRWRPLYLSKHYFKRMYFFTLELKKKVNIYYNDNKVKLKKNTPLVFDKSSTITKHLKNKYIYIYKGNLEKAFRYPPFYIGFKLSKFNITPKPFNFTQKKKKKKK